MPVESSRVVAVRPDPSGANKQGLGYFVGVSAETAGSTGICAHLVTIPPGGRAKAHLHEAHETIVYVLEGEVLTWHGCRSTPARPIPPSRSWRAPIRMSSRAA